MTGEIEAVTALHIGSGKKDIEIGDIDMPVLKDTAGQPYIPGSSLKGKVRSEAERIARKEGMFVCTPPDSMCGKIKNPEEFCICCRIFGTSGKIFVASKVKFRDAYPTKSIETMLTRTGIAIDREQGSAASGALYTVEAVPAGSAFSFEIVGDNLTEDELGMLLAAMKSVEDSAIGGSTSRGFGKVKFNFSRVSIRNADYYLGTAPEKVIEGPELESWRNRKGRK